VSRLTNGEHLLLTIIMVAFVLWLLALPARADLAPTAAPTVIAAAGTPVPVTGTPPTSSTRSAPTATPTPPWVSGPGWFDDPFHLFLPEVQP